MSAAVLTIDLMGNQLSKKQRALLLGEAMDLGWAKAAIARAIGTTGQNLENILTRDNVRSKYLPALDQWLVSNHDKPPVEVEEYSPQVRSALAEIAEEVEALAKTLRSSSLSEDYKASRLESFIRDVAAGILKARE